MTTLCLPTRPSICPNPVTQLHFVSSQALLFPLVVLDDLVHTQRLEGGGIAIMASSTQSWMEQTLATAKSYMQASDYSRAIVTLSKVCCYSIPTCRPE